MKRLRPRSAATSDGLDSVEIAPRESEPKKKKSTKFVRSLVRKDAGEVAREIVYHNGEPVEVLASCWEHTLAKLGEEGWSLTPPKK